MESEDVGQQEAVDVTETEPGLRASEKITILKQPPTSSGEAAEPHWKSLEDPRQKEHVVRLHRLV